MRDYSPCAYLPTNKKNTDSLQSKFIMKEASFKSIKNYLRCEIKPEKEFKK